MELSILEMSMCMKTQFSPIAITGIVALAVVAFPTRGSSQSSFPGRGYCDSWRNKQWCEFCNANESESWRSTAVENSYHRSTAATGRSTGATKGRHDAPVRRSGWRNNNSPATHAVSSKKRRGRRAD